MKALHGLSMEHPTGASHLRQHGAFVHDDGRVTFSVWAPRAERVQLVLCDGPEQHSIEMQKVADDWYLHEHGGLHSGDRYAFRLDEGPLLPDPASRWQPEGVSRPSAIFDPAAMHWTDRSWPGVPRKELAIYELHVGTFTPPGTFAAIVPRLAALRELGITAIELMPIAQFSGARGWGYDGVHPFAVHNGYGGPHELQRLVDACHANGLAVILDVVYNHFGPEGNYFAQFGPYFADRYRTPWGPALNYDDRGCDQVRELVLQNVRMWLRDFHVDGLRLDAVHAIFDCSPRHILPAIQMVADDESDRARRPIHVIAESNLNDVRLLNPAEIGGYGLSAQWCDDFHHAVHTLLTGERDGYYVDFGRPEHLVKAFNHALVYDGQYSVYRGRRHGAPAAGLPGDRFVVSIQNHDQVGNRALGDRFGTLLTPARQRLAAGLLLLSPYLPLLFMGEEYGEQRPFPFFCSFHDVDLAEAVRQGRRAEFQDFPWPDEIPDPQAEATWANAKIAWEWPDDTWQAGLRRWYRDLLAVRKQWAALHDFQHREARWCGDLHDGFVELLRGGNGSDAPWCLIYFNFSDRPQPLLAHLSQGLAESPWQPVLSSEWEEYGGSRLRDAVLHPESLALLPHEVLAFAPSQQAASERSSDTGGDDDV